MLIDRKSAQYARTRPKCDRWRKRIKFDLLLADKDKIEGQAAIDEVAARYHSFRRMHQTDGESCWKCT